MKSKLQGQGLARRLIVAIVLFSSLITLIISAVQLYRDYSYDLSLIDTQMRQIEDVHLRSIARSLWTVDEKEMKVLLDGLLQFPDMQFLEIKEGEKVWASVGNNNAKNVIVKQFQLTNSSQGPVQNIGTLTVVATLDDVYRRLLDKAVVILISNAIKTFIVAGFILLIIHLMVTRHLLDIARFLGRPDKGLKNPIKLNRKNHDAAKNDELDLVVDGFNLMRKDLHKSLEVLTESENRYRNLYDTMAQGVVYQDENGKIISVNNAACHILGQSSDQLLGITSLDPSWKIIYENGENFPGEYHPPMQALNTAKVINNVLMGVFHPVLQKFRWIIVDSIPQFRDGEGKPFQVYSTFTDITERKEAEEERQHLINELEFKNIELERFVYTASHELKAPLVTITGFTGILQKEINAGKTENLEHYASHIKSASSSMAVLLEELLELSRVGRVQSTMDIVSLNEVAKEAQDNVLFQAAENKVEINISADLPIVFGDRARLREVFINLMENAIKFSAGQPQPVVTIGSSNDADNIICFVEDNGIGIDPAFKDRVFDLFERFDSKIPGTGVGLTLVRRILEIHGGEVWVESRGTNKGSTFFFSIPKAA